MVGQNAAEDDSRVHSGAFNAVHLERDLPVVQKQDVSRFHIFVQLGICNTDTLVVAIVQSEARVKKELCSVLQRYLAVFESLYPNLRALQIAHEANFAPALCRCSSQRLDSCPMVLLLAVRKIYAGDVQAGIDDFS